MELHLDPATEAKLHELAERTRRGTDELLGEAVDYLVGYNDWFEQKIKASIAATTGGATIPDDHVAAWLERRERR